MKSYDFLQGQIRFFSGDKYEFLYEFFDKEYGIQYQELFIFLATVGFVNNKRGETDSKGKEFRSNYLTYEQKTVIYTILLSDIDSEINLEYFLDRTKLNGFRQLIESYAIGGIEYLIEAKFNGIIGDNYIQRNYKYYTTDVCDVIYDYLNDSFI